MQLNFYEVYIFDTHPKLTAQDSIDSMTKFSISDRFKHCFSSSIALNRWGALAECSLRVHALPEKYWYPAPLYIISLVKAQINTMKDEYEDFIQNMNRNKERKCVNCHTRGFRNKNEPSPIFGSKTVRRHNHE